MVLNPHENKLQVVAAKLLARPSWTQVWLNSAKLQAERSTCPRASTGAVIVSQDNQVLATGYNGAPRNLVHCAEVGCLMEGGHCVRAVHAEANALMQAARLGVAVGGAAIYVTHRPCQRCVLLLIQAGILDVYYAEAYESDDEATAQAMAIAGGIRWWRLG